MSSPSSPASTAPVASAETIGAVFDAVAESYDSMRRQLIPCFDGFYGAALDLVVEAAQGKRARILDLGAGTGLLTALVARALPDARFDLTDLAPQMLARARTRFAGDSRITLREMDHRALDAQATYDVVMSGLSIHHLEDHEKRALYAACARALKPGGRFVNADQVAGDSPAMEARYWRHWHERVVASGLPAAEIKAAIERQALDRRAPLDPQLHWLREAGLGEVECRFKDASFVVLAGDRA